MMRLSTFVFTILAASLLSVGVEGALITRYLHAISEIQSRFAITDILSQIENPDDTAQEALFSAQIPDSAFISNFSIETNGRVTYGDVKAKDDARIDYESAKSQGKSAGLVAQRPRETNNFDITVNIAPRSKVNFNLTYQELLVREFGVYKHILNIQPQQSVEDVQIDVLIADRGRIENIHVPQFTNGIGDKSNKELLELPDDPNVESRSALDNGGSVAYIYYLPTAARQNGQLVVLYDVDRGTDGSDIEVVNGYFVQFFAPETVTKGDKNVVFVLDKSGSMQGRKFQQLQNAMKKILNDLDQEDRFNVVFFSSDVSVWQQESVKATADNVRSAEQFVDQAVASGGTNINDALKIGRELLSNDRQQALASMILFLTDGQPTVGETNPDKIADNIKQDNIQTKYSIHGLAFGEDADYTLMKKIASGNQGLARKIYDDSDAPIQLTNFYEEISQPLLRQLNIRYISDNVDVGSLVQDNTALYYDGSEVVVVGKTKLQSDREIKASITGTSKGGPKQFMASASKMSSPPCFPVVRPLKGRQPRPVKHFDRCQPLSDEEISRPVLSRPLPAANTVGGFIERMWAYKTIKKYLSEAEISQNTADQQAKRQQALLLSIKYHFVSDVTSMVVIPPDESTAQLLGTQSAPAKGTKPTAGVVPPSASGGSGRIDRLNSRLGSLLGRVSGTPSNPNGQTQPQSSVMVGGGKEVIKPIGTSCSLDVFIIIDISSSSDFALQLKLINDVMKKLPTNGTRYSVSQLTASRNVKVIKGISDSSPSITPALAMARSERPSSSPNSGDGYTQLIRDLTDQPQRRKTVLWMTTSNDAAKFDRVASILRRGATAFLAIQSRGTLTAQMKTQLTALVGNANNIFDNSPSADAIAKKAQC